MGADIFMVSVAAKNATKAFRKAVEEAQYDYGHAGYTGTIAEKDSFVMIPFDGEGFETAEKYAESLIDEGDKRINDKWGPVGCIMVKDNRFQVKKGQNLYLFFGWASS